MDTGQPIINLQDISLRIGGKTLLHRCNWQLHSGEQWAIIGGQESGKSIFSRIVAGIIPHSGGEISYSFQEIEPYPEPDEYIGYLSFEYVPDENEYYIQARYWSQYESMEVDEYLSRINVFEINPFEVGADQRNAGQFNASRKRIIDLLKIRDLLSKQLHQLSHGEWHKVKMAHVFLRNFPVLIIDNPFGGLDKKYKKHLLSIFSTLVQEGTQLLLTFEHLHGIPAFITHRAVFDHGRLVASGKLSSIDRSPAAYTQSLLKPRRLPGIPVGRARPDAEMIIRMVGVTISAHSRIIIDNLNWNVRKAERWIITGPNGSGKTTLLSCVSGDHPQVYANDITVFGRRWGEGSIVSEVKKRIGWVSPELQHAFPRNYTCLETVCSGYYESMGLFNRCGVQRRKYASEWLRALCIEQHWNTPLSMLSEGAIRLVLIARAFVKTPDLLVFDEPCQGLDDRHTQFIIDLIDRVCCSRPVALLMATHEPELISHWKVKGLALPVKVSTSTLE